MTRVGLQIAALLTFATTAHAASTTVPPSGGATTGDEGAINSALNTLEMAGGGTLYLEGGTYYAGPNGGGTPGTAGQYSIKIPSNIHFVMPHDCRIVRRITGAGGQQNATIRNKDQNGGNANIKVTGGVIDIEDDDNIGHQVAFSRVSNLTINGTRWEGTSNGWNAKIRDCTDVLVIGIKKWILAMKIRRMAFTLKEEAGLL